MNFFIDRNVPDRCARMVAAYEPVHPVFLHDKLFEPTAKDVDWISALAAKEGHWAVISGDGGILRNAAELQALRQTNLHFFLLRKNWWNGDFHDRAVQFLKVWRSIVERATSERYPRIWEVPLSSLNLADRGKTNDVAGT